MLALYTLRRKLAHTVNELRYCDGKILRGQEHVLAESAKKKSIWRISFRRFPVAHLLSSFPESTWPRYCRVALGFKVS